ncbi:hypothetical protein [Streptomyces fulvoviolaceus]|uniref:hypothetical protein n=1 Tax=Streptomyces fulvoviolaceus TaxID=285535 RepID=UPI0021BF4CE6|nr:hypothetical protein [Streptomyces fulvoviolaceus]MCT9080482.1 hypothetical protein [Streptomyces fulvoviolaceus]
MSIADRAASAYELLRQHSTHPLISDHRAADIARTAVRLAALLGIDPAHVRPKHSWNYLSLPLAPLTLHASDPDDPQRVYTFSYRDPLYDDEPFYLLGPCPVCECMVPLAEIRSLADLGAFLADGPAPLPDNGILPDSYPDEFDRHPAHSSDCLFREGES